MLNKVVNKVVFPDENERYLGSWIGNGTEVLGTLGKSDGKILEVPYTVTMKITMTKSGLRVSSHYKYAKTIVIGGIKYLRNRSAGSYEYNLLPDDQWFKALTYYDHTDYTSQIFEHFRIGEDGALCHDYSGQALDIRGKQPLVFFPFLQSGVKKMMEVRGSFILRPTKIFDEMSYASYTSATFERVKIDSKKQIKTNKYIFNLKYVGTQENVCVYQITNSKDTQITQGELFLNKTTNQITLCYISVALGRSDYAKTCILTKKGNNFWSGSQIESHVPPVGECAAITKFSFINDTTIPDPTDLY